MTSPAHAVCIALIVALSGCDETDSSQPIDANQLICGTNQRNTPDKTCIVDGDTLWLQRVNIRLKAFDTPESRGRTCSGDAGSALGKKATQRLQALLNGNAWTIETFGIDGSGKRRLVTIQIDYEDVGDILIREGLARRWPDGPEFWCAT